MSNATLNNNAGGGGGGPVDTLTGDTGGPIAPIASNINTIAGNSTNNSGCTVLISGNNTNATLTLNVTDSNQNTVIGMGAGNSPYNAAQNTVLGYQAGAGNTASSLCTLIGFQAGNAITSGSDHTAIGSSAGASLTSGISCVCVGSGAGSNVVGGSYDICIGSGAGRLLSGGDSNNIIICHAGVSGDNNTIRIGDQGSGANQQNKCVIAGITGVSVSNLNYVTINTSTGQLGSTAGGGIASSFPTDSGTGTPSSGVLNIKSGNASPPTPSSTGCGSSVQFTGSSNTVEFYVTDASNNTAIGFQAGNTTLGGSNTLLGYECGLGLPNACAFNTFIGSQVFALTATGNVQQNVIIGQSAWNPAGAIVAAVRNTGCGTSTMGQLQGGSNNSAFGFQSGNSWNGTESSNIAIGNTGTSGDNNTIRIGSQGSGSAQQNLCYIAGIAGGTVSAGSPTFGAVVIDTSDGQLVDASTGIATSGFVLTSNGTATKPSWKAPATSGTVTSVSVVSANGFAGTVATATTTPAITLTTTITGVLSGNGTAISGSAVTQYDVLVGGASNTVSSVGPGSAGQVLQSAGNAANPAYSTATYPSTTTINQILYSSSNNVVAGLSTVNSAVLATTSGGAPQLLSMAADGDLLIGSSAGAPVVGTLTPGTGVSITNGHNSITISTSGADHWVDQTTSSVTMATNTGYTSDDGASLVTFTLPTSSAIGDWVEINGKGSGLWTIAQASGQQIKISLTATTSGATGTLSSVNQFDNVRLRCLTANTIWTVVSQQSTGLTVV